MTPASVYNKGPNHMIYSILATALAIFNSLVIGFTVALYIFG